MIEVALETLPNVNIRELSCRDKNPPIMSVTESINQNLFKVLRVPVLFFSSLLSKSGKKQG